MGLLTFLVLYIIVVNHSSTVLVVCANWCVARSDASNQALQAALDYACGAGADCTPLESNGLCVLPNTLQAHASYAFNSYFQRKAMAPGSCDFSGTATIAQTDPSYGSCVYPSSLSTAGGTTTTTTPTTTTVNSPSTPTTSTTYNPPVGDGLNTGSTPTVPTTYNSKASLQFMVSTVLVSISCLLVSSLTLQPMLVF